jgi:dynein light chain LC8-type
MQQDVINLAAEAMAKYELEKDIAMHCKKELDRKFSTTWHVVVGKK